MAEVVVNLEHWMWDLIHSQTVTFLHVQASGRIQRGHVIVLRRLDENRILSRAPGKSGGYMDMYVRVRWVLPAVPGNGVSGGWQAVQLEPVT